MTFIRALLMPMQILIVGTALVACDTAKAPLPAFPDFALATCHDESMLGTAMNQRESAVISEMKDRLGSVSSRKIHWFDTTCHVSESNIAKFTAQMRAYLTRSGWRVTDEALSKHLKTRILSAQQSGDRLNVALISLKPQSEEYLIYFQSTLDFTPWEADYRQITAK